MGLSVSRVGSAAQIPAMRQVAGGLKLELAQYREVEAFAQFGSDLDASTQHVLNRGSRLIELLKQNQFIPMPIEYQVVIIFAGMNGFLDKIATNKVSNFEQKLLNLLKTKHTKILNEIKEQKKISPELKKKLQSLLTSEINL